MVELTLDIEDVKGPIRTYHLASLRSLSDVLIEYDLSKIIFSIYKNILIRNWGRIFFFTSIRKGTCPEIPMDGQGGIFGYLRHS